MRLLAMLLLAFSATVGSLWQIGCDLDVSNVEYVMLGNGQDPIILAGEQLFDLAATTTAIPADAEFLNQGVLLMAGSFSELPSFVVYTTGDRYYIELYETNVWYADEEIEPCATAEIVLEL